jgi:hypothetical protein
MRIERTNRTLIQIEFINYNGEKDDLSFFSFSSCIGIDQPLNLPATIYLVDSNNVTIDCHPSHAQERAQNVMLSLRHYD